MNWIYLILIVLILIWFFTRISSVIHKEKLNYNDGECPNCGHKWRAFDVDHTGAIGLICDKCGNVMWLDWCRKRWMR